MISTLDTYVILICLPWVTFMFESFLSVHLNEQTFTTELNRSEDVRYESQNTNTLELFKIDMIDFFIFINVKTYLVSSDIQQLMQLCGWNNGPPMKIKTSQDKIQYLFIKFKIIVSRSVRVSLSNMIIILIVHWCRFCIWYMYSNEHNR